MVLLTFLYVSISCHLIHSFFLCLPPPIPLFYFIVGKDNKDGKIVEETGSEIEFRNLNGQFEAKLTKSNNTLDSQKAKRNKLACCIFAIALFVGLAVSPFYGFHQLSGDSKLAQNGKKHI